MNVSCLLQAGSTSYPCIVSGNVTTEHGEGMDEELGALLYIVAIIGKRLYQFSIKQEVG